MHNWILHAQTPAYTKTQEHRHLLPVAAHYYLILQNLIEISMYAFQL